MKCCMQVHATARSHTHPHATVRKRKCTTAEGSVASPTPDASAAYFQRGSQTATPRAGDWDGAQPQQ